MVFGRGSSVGIGAVPTLFAIDDVGTLVFGTVVTRRGILSCSSLGVSRGVMLLMQAVTLTVQPLEKVELVNIWCPFPECLVFARPKISMETLEVAILIIDIEK